jgi:hypothetical protein
MMRAIAPFLHGAGLQLKQPSLRPICSGVATATATYCQEDGGNPRLDPGRHTMMAVI